MKNKVRKYWMMAATLMVFIYIPVLAADDGIYYAHLKYYEGEVLVQRANDAEITEAIRNMPLMAGDRLWTGIGRVDIQLFEGSTLSLDENTKIDFEAIGEPIDGYGENTILKLWSGSVYLQMYHDFNRDQSLKLDTPSGYVSILNKGSYRIDVDQDYTVRITVYDGLVETGNQFGSEMIRSGQRLFLEPGQSPSDSIDFADQITDDFGNWIASRESTYRDSYVERNHYVEDSLDYLVDDMDDYGDWHYYDEYHSYVWVPQTRYIYADWRPYYHGQWLWTPHGWSFASYDPWSWVTYRYGRWDYCGPWGWCWIPGYRYSSAWVHWEIGYDYIGWAPLGYYNYPVSRYFYKQYPRGYKSRWPSGSEIAMDGSSWTVVKKSNFTSKAIQKQAYSAEKIKNLNRKNATYHTAKIQPDGFEDKKINRKYSTSSTGSVYKEIPEGVKSKYYKKSTVESPASTSKWINKKSGTSEGSSQYKYYIKDRSSSSKESGSSYYKKDSSSTATKSDSTKSKTTQPTKSSSSSKVIMIKKSDSSDKGKDSSSSKSNSNSTKKKKNYSSIYNKYTPNYNYSKSSEDKKVSRSTERLTDSYSSKNTKSARTSDKSYKSSSSSSKGSSYYYVPRKNYTLPTPSVKTSGNKYYAPKYNSNRSTYSVRSNNQSNSYRNYYKNSNSLTRKYISPSKSSYKSTQSGSSLRTGSSKSSVKYSTPRSSSSSHRSSTKSSSSSSSKSSSSSSSKKR